MHDGGAWYESFHVIEMREQVKMWFFSEICFLLIKKNPFFHEVFFTKFFQWTTKKRIKSHNKPPKEEQGEEEKAVIKKR